MIFAEIESVNDDLNLCLNLVRKSVRKYGEEGECFFDLYRNQILRVAKSVVEKVEEEFRARCNLDDDLYSLPFESAVEKFVEEYAHRKLVLNECDISKTLETMRFNGGHFFGRERLEDLVFGTIKWKDDEEKEELGLFDETGAYGLSDEVYRRYAKTKLLEGISDSEKVSLGRYFDFVSESLSLKVVVLAKRMFGFRKVREDVVGRYLNFDLERALSLFARSYLEGNLELYDRDFERAAKHGGISVSDYVCALNRI